MSKNLKAEYARLFGEAEAATATIEALVEKGEKMTDEDRSALKAAQEANEKRFSRLSEIKAALDQRTAAATFALEAGKADTGKEVPGRQAHEQHRQEAEGGPITPEKHREAINLFVRSQGKDPRAFAITTTSGSGILVPVSVLPPLVLGLDHVVARAKSFYGQTARLSTPFNETINQPVMGFTGSKITQGATSATISDPALTDSFTLVMQPYGSGVAYFSNTVLNAPGYDVVSATMPSLQRAVVIAEENDFLTTIKGVSGLVSAAKKTTTTSAISYADLISFVEQLPARWQADQATVLSAAAYAAVLGLTSDAGNRLVTVAPNGQLLVKGTPVFKDQSGALDGFGASKILGVTFSCSAVVIRDNPNMRANVYTSDQKRDQTGIELTQDHAWGYAQSGVVLLST